MPETVNSCHFLYKDHDIVRQTAFGKSGLCVLPNPNKTMQTHLRKNLNNKSTCILLNE